MKLAIVTGANRGLGLGTSQELAKKGYKVLMTGRKRDAIENSVGTLKAKGLDVEAYVLDVASDESVASFAKEISAKYQKLDVLVNNAGVFLEEGFPKGPETSIENVFNTLNINSVGAVRTTIALLPLLEKATSANIVNVSSGMGQLSEMGGSVPGYRMSKSAMNAMTKTFAADLAETKVKINSVCPGWVQTDMGGPNADRSLGEGVSGIVWAATLPEDGPSGLFFRDGERLDW